MSPGLSVATLEGSRLWNSAFQILRKRSLTRILCSTKWSIRWRMQGYKIFPYMYLFLSYWSIWFYKISWGWWKKKWHNSKKWGIHVGRNWGTMPREQRVRIEARGQVILWRNQKNLEQYTYVYVQVFGNCKSLIGLIKVFYNSDTGS